MHIRLLCIVIHLALGLIYPRLGAGSRRLPAAMEFGHIDPKVI